jgi:hypothetical protein
MCPRVIFVCQSSDCRRNIEIALPPNETPEKFSNPRCTCGSEMKRAYSKFLLRELSKKEAMRLGHSVSLWAGAMVLN